MKGSFINLIAAFALLSCKAPKPAIPASVKTAEAVSVADPKPVISRSEVPAEKPAPIPSKTLVWLDFESGYKKAVAEDKIILVDMYTNWCYWCKVMDRETYTDSVIIAEINTHFVPVKMNPEVDATFRFGDTVMNNAELFLWLGHGKQFGFPTSYFWLQPGKSDERYCLAGYHEPSAFMQILKQIEAKKAAK
jgi:thioredoxin-related protein